MIYCSGKMHNSFDNVLVGSQEFNSRCSLIVNEIKDGKSSFLDVVENLRSLLTSALNEQRIKGVAIVSTVLDVVPSGCISSVEIDTLANFLCDRLKDHHEVLPAVIKALVVVTNTKDLSKGTATKILSAIFHHVPCQQQQQADRYNIYRIFKHLHETSKDELRGMGLDLIYGVITAIDGERDPRNLSFLFEWLEVFLEDFELGHLSEEMFEVLACYFPVDFRPSSEDTITRDALAQSLSKCLCASQKFGDFIVPLALEKLDSELTTAKMDSLEVLDLVGRKFPPDLLLKYGTAIWAPLHKEILTARNEELRSRALKTLESFVRSVSNKPDATTSSLLQSMVLNVKGNATPDSKLFEPSCKIIFSTAASRISSEYVVETIVPLWVNLYNITVASKDRVEILKVLCELCAITIGVTGLTFDNAHLREVPCLFLRALTESDVDLKSEALKCFVKIARFLPRELREIFFENLGVLLFLPFEQDERSLLLHCFREYAKFYPAEIEGLIESLKTKSDFKLYLETIGSVLEIKQLWPVCVKELTGYALENSKENSRIPLKIFSQILEKQQNSGLEEYLIAEEDFVIKLTDWFIAHSKEFDPDVDCDLLDDISSILYRVISRLDIEAQTKILTLTMEKVRSKPVEQTFPIWFGVLVGLKEFQLEDVEVWDKFLEVAFRTRHLYVNRILSQLIGNLLNKLNSGDVLNKVLTSLENRIISSERCDIENLINVLSFTTKGLVLRGHDDATAWTNKVLQLCGEHKEACKSVGIILDGTYAPLSKVCYVKERLLYKQKFFTDVTAFIANCGTEDVNYLTVIAYLVQGVPESLLYMYLTKVIRWIVLYLSNCDDSVTAHNLCQILNRAIQSKEEEVFRYTNEILNVYLKLSLKNPSMKVRIESLKGIRLFTRRPVREIIGRKPDVVKSLDACIDDRKRLVRKEAMETRLKWYLIDSPI